MMRKVNMPPINFSPWVKWEDRNSVPDIHFPGIYMLAITIKNLSGEKPKYEDACYIGITNSQGGLISRWGQFNNSIRGKQGHSGGKTVFADLGHYETWKNKLYVCGMPVPCDTKNPNEIDLLKMGQVAYLEYEAFSKFYTSSGRLKNQNTIKNSGSGSWQNKKLQEVMPASFSWLVNYVVEDILP